MTKLFFNHLFLDICVNIKNRFVPSLYKIWKYEIIKLHNEKGIIKKKTNEIFKFLYLFVIIIIVIIKKHLIIFEKFYRNYVKNRNNV